MRAFNNWMEVDDEDMEPGVYTVTVEVPKWEDCAINKPVY